MAGQEKMIRHRRIVLPEVGINEIGSDYFLFWRNKRTQFGYFKLTEIPHAALRILRNMKEIMLGKR